MEGENYNGLGGVDVGDVDVLRDGASSDKEGVCQACHSLNYVAPPGPTPAQETTVLWVGCERCDRWYHAPCVGIDTATFDRKKPWFCPLCPGPS